MDKKELKIAYKQFKPYVGVYIYKYKQTNKIYLDYGQNMKGDMISIAFQLKFGNFITNTKCNLQNDWKEYDESNFFVAEENDVIEKLSKEHYCM